MKIPSHVKIDSSERYVFVRGKSGKPIVYVRVEDVYAALSRAGIQYGSIVSDEIDAKFELLEELKTRGW